MKKILLVKPHYYNIPIGIAYVLTTLQAHAIPFDFVDLTISSVDLKRLVRQNDYLAVASGGLVAEFNFFREFAKTAKSVNPDLPVIFGGNLTSALSPDMLFENLLADFAVLDEAETSLPELVARLDAGDDDFRKAPGIVYRDKRTGAVVKNRPVMLDLGKTDPTPAWDLIDIGFYLARCQHQTFAPLRTFMPILTGRGCSGRCAFCNPTLGRFRPRRTENILAEMRHSLATYAFDVFSFTNEVFFANEAEILDFCRQYREQGFNREWFCSLRLDVDPVVLQTMQESGCIGVSVGFESASDAILKVMKKGITASKGRAFVQTAKSLGMPLECNIMVGNEGETPGDLKQSFDMLREQRVDANINLTVAYVGTLFFAHAVERGLVPSVPDQVAKEKYVGLYNPDIASHDYLNISAFPSLEALHDATMELYRQATGELLERYEAKAHVGLQDGRVRAMWRCRACAEDNVLESSIRQFDGLVRKRFCAGCGAFSYIRMLPAAVRERLTQSLAGCERVLILGDDINAQSLLAYPLDGLDYGKILAFAEVGVPDGSNRKFFFHKKVSLRHGSQLFPDIVLSLSRDLDFNPQPFTGLFQDQAPPLIPLTPNLFPVEIMRDRRLVFIGADSSIPWLRLYLDDIAGVKIVGAVNWGQAKGPTPEATPRLGLSTLFGGGWDVAVMTPGVYGPGLGNAVLRLAAFVMILAGKRPVLHRVAWITGCIAWIPWRRAEIVNRAVEWAAAGMRRALFRRWSWK